MKQTVRLPLCLLFAALLTACGSGGDRSSLPAGNQAPVAHGGADRTVDELTTVTLDGRGSQDADGRIASYAWTQTAGPAVTLSSASSAQPSFRAPDVSSAQTLSFRLTVTDDRGATASDEVSIVVQPVNRPPTANAGADRGVDEQTVVTLDGRSSSDADGSVTGYAWTQTAGPTVTLSDAGAAQARFTAPDVSSAQTLSFRLTVTDNQGASASDSISITVNAVVLPTIALSGTQLAQTHVLPAAGTTWTTTGGAREELHFIAGRAALFLTEVSPISLSNPQVEGRATAGSLGTVSLMANSALPATEAGGERYSSSLSVAQLPARWMQPGLQLRVSASNAQASDWIDVNVGADSHFVLRTLPFYLFGADTADLSEAAATTPPTAANDEAYAKWPVATLSVVNHPVKKVSWPTLVVPPRTDSGGTARAAYVATATESYKDGFAGLATLHGLVGALRTANGESNLAVHYYAPLIAQNSAGTYQNAGGGIGGGSVGTGDVAYAGIYIHEQGHAFGLPHAGESYAAGGYPYEWGSLKGSNWGYDVIRGEFLAPFVPMTASTYASCRTDTFAGHDRSLDAQNRCVKQDPMQSGSGDQADGYRFATFADFSTAVMQRYFEGVTTLNASNQHVYSGGKLVRDASYAGGYKRWDTLDRAWAAYTPTTSDFAQYGFLQRTPVAENLPVYAIVITASKAGGAGLTQIYPPLAFTGNLIQLIDPTSASDRARVRHYRAPYNGNGDGRWFCSNSGCDYTLRVTYGNGTVRHVLLQGAFRNFDYPAGGHPSKGDFDPNSAIATDGASFQTWAVNVPADSTISKIELLDTPLAWADGVPASPTVLASR